MIIQVWRWLSLLTITYFKEKSIAFVQEYDRVRQIVTRETVLLDSGFQSRTPDNIEQGWKSESNTLLNYQLGHNLIEPVIPETQCLCDAMK